METIVYSSTGIFLVYRRPHGTIENAWFHGPLDCVRWLRLYAGPLGYVDSIVSIQFG